LVSSAQLSKLLLRPELKQYIFLGVFFRICISLKNSLSNVQNWMKVCNDLTLRENDIRNADEIRRLLQITTKNILGNIFLHEATL